MAMSPFKITTDKNGAVSYGFPKTESNDYTFADTLEHSFTIPTFGANNDKPVAIIITPQSGVDIYVTDDTNTGTDSIVSSGAGKQYLITSRTLIQLGSDSTHLHIKPFSQPAAVNVGWLGDDTDS
jgi:hypothetical protein